MADSEHPHGPDNPYEHFEPYAGPHALRSQIARTRADLGDTIQELASRADVKARAREMVSDARERTKRALRIQARRATRRTRGAAMSGASSVRYGLRRASRTPASVAAGAGLGALAGYGVFELLKRRSRPARRRR
jgi:hypothetical protein